jgi:hypothetical protein
MLIGREDTRLFAGFPADYWESDGNPSLVLPYDEHDEVARPVLSDGARPHDDAALNWMRLRCF